VAVVVEALEAEEHQSDAEHAVDAEERGVAVDGRGVEALHVVEGDGRVDEEAEEAGADEVPEGDGDEEVDGPLVGLDPGLGTGELAVLVGLPADPVCPRGKGAGW
jgi:hypothetical protein